MPQTKKQKTPPRSGKRKKNVPQTAQQTIPYREMFKDGICKVRDGFYTKTIEYEDINYSVASSDDQSAIFDGYCGFLNYFDCVLPFQKSFINQRSRQNSYSVNISPQDDDYNSVRGEFTDMLKGQIAKSNNGIMRSKYITFGLPAESVGAARPRLERVEADILGNYKKLGVMARGLSGRDRLEILHNQLHPGGKEKFNFSWADIAKTGLSTKDFIAPPSFDFRQPRLVIDRQRTGENVYLLNAVTEADLLSLAKMPEQSAQAPAVTEPPPAPAEPEPDPPAPEKSGGAGMMIIVVLVVLVGGGAGYYFKIYRPKQQQADSAGEFDGEEYDEDESDPYGGDQDADYDGADWDAVDGGRLPDIEPDGDGGEDA